MLRRSVIATIAVLGTLAVSAAPASAATGRVTLRHTNGASSVLLNPPPGCFNSFAAFNRVANQTNSFVVSYGQLGCSGGLSIVLSPGQTANVPPSMSLAVIS
jgi:hypothetical protein